MLENVNAFQRKPVFQVSIKNSRFLSNVLIFEKSVKLLINY